MSAPLLVGGPTMLLARCVAAPAIECVVKSKAGFELFEIVGIHARQTERSREQTRRFRREIEAICVGSAHYLRQPQQRRRPKAEFLNHHIEGAGLAAMTPEHPFDIEWSRAEPSCGRLDFGRCHEQEYARGLAKQAGEQG